MSYDKAKVNIDLDEYLYLKEKAKEREKGLDYIEAYNILIDVVSKRGPLTDDILNEINTHNDKYIFAKIIGPQYEADIQVALKKQYMILNRIQDNV